MHLNWSTFILEIINFLVLVWILKRIFYVPIQKAIDERKKAVEKSLTEANGMRNDANNLKEQYENRLSIWEKEKEQKNVALLQEIDEERISRLKKLKDMLAKEREKHKAAEKQQMDEFLHKIEQQAEVKAAKFAAKLLQQFASQYLEEQIIKLFLKQLPFVAAERINLIKDELSKEGRNEIVIKSAFSLQKMLKDNVISSLKKLFGDYVIFTFKMDDKLLAGLCVTIGSVIMHANLRDELKFFSEIPFHE